MKTFSEKLIEELERDEGVKLEPYVDTTGHLTIGVGHKLCKIEGDFKLSDFGKISIKVSRLLLEEDINNCICDLVKLDIFNSLSLVRQNVLINMRFNLGLKGLLKFKRMFKALEKKDYITASKEMLDSKWAKQVGNRAKRLAHTMKEG